MKGFMEFIREQRVIGLAVGFILGGAIGKLVASFVTDLINPILGIVLGLTGGLRDAYFKIGPAKIMWGNFLNTAVDFFIIVLVVYSVVKGLRLDKLDRKKK